MRKTIERGARPARRSFGLAVLMGAVCALPAAGQTDSVTVVAGPQYEAGGLKLRLFGEDYRDLWTMPIRVPVLDLERMHGGLTPVDVGGGQQTRSLQLEGADGREYRFRSVHKWPARARHPDLEGTLVGKVIQDQVSSIVPAAPVAAARIAIAVGHPHPLPNLYVLPDNASLGEYREEFAGLLGTLEEYPNEGEDGRAGFMGLDRITATETFLEAIETEAGESLDSRAYLSARLTDLILGDWDRHSGQWRWSRQETRDGAVWRPVPRDRDYAFSEYDGLALDLIRMFAPNAVRFSAGYKDLGGLILNAAELDRRLLADLDRGAWDEVTAEVQAALTDAEIEDAIGALPREYRAARGAELIERLKSRRDSLRSAANRFYSALARAPEIHATDAAEVATIQRYAAGDVHVTIRGGAGQTIFERRFLPGETREIQLNLRGGDDRAVVRGPANRGIRVRIVGGEGDDVLADSSRVRQLGSWTAFHDSEGENVFIRSGATTVDRRPHEEVETDPNALVPIRPPQFGTRIGIAPVVDYSTTRGAILGARLRSTTYAFRRRPYATQLSADALFSPRWLDVGMQVHGRHQTADPSLALGADLVATRIDARRFYGFGNETERDLPSDRYVVRRELLEGVAEVVYTVGPSVSIGGGITGLYSRPWLVAGGPLAELRPLGSNGFAAFGFSGGFQVDTEGDAETPRLLIDLDGSVYPVVSEGGSYFADAEGVASIRVPLGAEGTTAVAARVGGRKAWRDYPFFAAAHLGGRESIRGLPHWRYAGDASVFGGAEASTYLMRLPFIMNWRVGAFVFADAGRVFLAGEDSDRWHTAPGAGLSLSALSITLRASYAHGPEPRLYLETRAPF